MTSQDADRGMSGHSGKARRLSGASSAPRPNTLRSELADINQDQLDPEKEAENSPTVDHEGLRLA